MEIIKRDGRKVPFDASKIKLAIFKAWSDVDGTIDDYGKEKAEKIASFIESKSLEQELTIENIQDLVVAGLMNTSRKDIAAAYVEYRHDRSNARESNIDKIVDELLKGTNDEINRENSNKNPIIVSTQRDYLAGIYSKDLTERKLLPKKIVEAHRKGIIHFHDSDYFAQLALTNCSLINLEDMLQNGCMINNVLIEKPHKFSTACTIATQIILGVSSSQYGGCTISLTHLAPFVRSSFIKYLKKSIRHISKGDAHLDDIINEKVWDSYSSIKLHYPRNYDYAMELTMEDLNAGVQTFNYQVNSMSNSNGQAPFLSVFMYLGETEEYKTELAWVIEEFLKQRILGFKNKQGIYVAPAFPKLLYVTEEDNINPDSKYFYLTKLAAECTAKRMVPDYISEKVMKENKDGNCFPCMSCRSFLAPWYDKDGKPKFYGRTNMGVCTINLPHVALSSGGDINKFWQILEERSELCHEALKIRFKRISQITSDVAPLLWQHGAFARLKPNQSIKELLYDGYTSISFGYAGLYECVLYMTGESHSKGDGKMFGLDVMKFLNNKCEKWKEEDRLGYSLYGTPIESTTYKFAKALQRDFGKEITGITDKNYITNSYHINVAEEIDAFSKLSIEAEYQQLSTGGCISYVETPDMKKNIPAVIELITYMYNHIMYAEINTKLDYCEECGYDGEIIIKGEPGNLYWECPCCGNRNRNTMHITRRVCGYLSSYEMNQGRIQDIKERVLHLG